MNSQETRAKIKEGDKILVKPKKQDMMLLKEKTGYFEDQRIIGRSITCNVVEIEEKLFLLSDIFASLRLSGKRGYDNALNIVDKICKEIYGVSASSIDRKSWEKIRNNEKLNASGDYWVGSKVVDTDEWRNFHGIIISSANGDSKKGILYISDKRVNDAQSILECSENTCEAGIRFLMEVSVCDTSNVKKMKQ